VRSGENEGICHWQRGLGLNYVMPPANGSSYSIGRIIFWSSQVYSLWPLKKMPHDGRFQWSWVSFHSLFVSNQQRISTLCITSAFVRISTWGDKILLTDPVVCSSFFIV
jgi:hypothetical protein